METRSDRAAEAGKRCPKARPFRQPTDEELLLARIERTVDEIIEALLQVTAPEPRESGAGPLKLVAAARRLSGLASRLLSRRGS